MHPAPDTGQLLDRLKTIEESLTRLIERHAAKEWYTTREVATLLGKARFTVQEWARLGRIHARKRACGRGKSKEWVISHGELQRIRCEGLLPPPKPGF